MRTHEAKSAGGACCLAAVGLAGLLVLAGCKKNSENNAASTPAAQQSSAAAPSSNQAMTGAPPPSANQAMTGAAPPSTSAPSSNEAMTGAPPPSANQVMTAAPPPPQVYTVPRGARLSVRISETLSEKESNVGDTFRGRLAASVRVNGVPVFKAGTPVTGTVAAVRKQGKFKGEGNLGIVLTRVGSQPVTTSEYERTVKGKGKRSAGFIAGGGGGGALIGGLAGGGKGALIGGLVGAGAGTAGAAFTGNKDVVIPAESVVSFSLASPVTVTLQPAAEAPPPQP